MQRAQADAVDHDEARLGDFGGKVFAPDLEVQGKEKVVRGQRSRERVRDPLEEELGDCLRELSDDRRD